MRKQGAFRRWLVLLSAAVLAGVPAAQAGGGADGGSAPPAESVVPDLGSLGLPLGELLGQALEIPGQLDGPGLLRVPGAVRVLLLSSGIDGAAFGDAYAERLTVHGGGDPVGLGTYAASVLFQVAPEAHLTSINVYEGEHVHRGRLIQALEFARDHAGDLDGVAFAFPPAEVLDPMAAGLASGRWETLSDAAGGGPLHQLAESWSRLRALVAELGAAGLTVVAPAGDLGPAPQSLLGVAGLPEVVTVGAYDGQGIAAASASGPSVHGGAKPDLIAPVGLPGLVPEESALAAVLPAGPPPMDRADLDLPFPPAGGRPAFIGSTIPAAVGVAATVAQLRVDGVKDPAAVRGVLAAAAVPEPGVPVWRQGAGVLREAPTAALAGSRPLIGGPLHLGAEPLSGRTWEAAAAVVGGQVAGTPAVSFPWRLETAPDGTRQAIDVPDGAPRPAPVISEAGDTLRLALTPGDNPWAPGAWCGYLQVPLGDVGSTVAGVVEDLPLCLVEGLTLTAFNAYIHDVPAEDLTFALIPALPPGVSLLAGPLAVLPLDPLHEPVLAGVSGTDGMVRFANVPPAFYVMRQFSDYGAPIVEVFDGAGATRARDVGEAASYLGYDALVLPNPCAERVQDHMETGTDCHRAHLEQRFGPVEYDPSTARYLVDTPAGRMGVVFDFAKKVAGVGVSSRYVDLLAHDDLTHGSAVSLDDLHGPLPERLVPRGPGGAPLIELSNAWTFSTAGTLGDPEGTLAAYKGLDLQHDPASVAGISTYPFALSTPNYQGTMSLNFRYDIDDALVGVIVQVAGKGPHVTLLTPQGKIEVPHLDPAKPVAVALRQAALSARPREGEQPAPPPQLDPKRLFGAATGQVGLRLDLQPGGASEGTLTFVYVPLEPARPASVHVGDLSFEVTTWQRIDWPRAHLPRNGRMVMGHSFNFNSHYRPGQMNHPACRRLTDGELAAEVCENWQVFVHSPFDDAETFDLVDTASGRGFMGEVRTGGGGLFNPHRGVHGNREEFAVAGVGLPLGRGVITNGRFWEQLVVPAATLAAHPGDVEVRIEDNQPGGRSTLLDHADGPMPVSPYVPFTAWHRHVEAGLLDDLGVAPSRH